MTTPAFTEVENVKEDRKPGSFIVEKKKLSKTASIFCALPKGIPFRNKFYSRVFVHGSCWGCGVGFVMKTGLGIKNGMFQREGHRFFFYIESSPYNFETRCISCRIFYSRGFSEAMVL